VFFKVEENVCFQNELGYSQRCKFLQSWRCNSRALDCHQVEETQNGIFPISAVSGVNVNVTILGIFCKKWRFFLKTTVMIYIC
jgi:hypothetical protein